MRLLEAEICPQCEENGKKKYRVLTTAAWFLTSKEDAPGESVLLLP